MNFWNNQRSTETRSHGNLGKTGPGKETGRYNWKGTKRVGPGPHPSSTTPTVGCVTEPASSYAAREQAFAPPLLTLPKN